jgi:hypothetical protein
MTGLGSLFGFLFGIGSAKESLQKYRQATGKYLYHAIYGDEK